MWFCRSPFWTKEALESLEFTTCFENTVFVWIPSFVLWIGGIAHIIINANTKYDPLPFTVLGSLRFFLTVCLIVIQGALCCVHYIRDDGLDMSISALQRSFNACFVLGLLVWYHYIGKPSSMFLTVYWLLMTSCDTFKFYRLLMLHFSKLLYANYTDTIKCFSFVILLLQLALSFPNDKTQKPHLDRSPLERLTFGWLSSRIKKCYKGFLDESDIKLLPEDVRTANILEEPRIAEYELKANRHWYYLMRPHFASVLYASFLNVTFVCMRISASLMLNAIVLYMEGKTTKYKGYMYVISIFLLNLISSLVLRHSEYILMIVGLKVKAVLINSAYRKIMRLSGSSLRKYTLTDIMNIFAQDVEKINNAIGFIGLISSGPVHVVVTAVALWQFIGPSCLAGIVTLVTLIAVTAWLAEEVKLLQNNRGRLATTRQKKISEILQNIRAIKLYDWEAVFTRVVYNCRQNETKALRHLNWVISTIRCGWGLTPFLVAVAAFYSYLESNNITNLQASTAYVCMSLFSGMRFALSILPDAITALVQAHTSVQKIFDFLDQSEVEETIFVAKSGSLINGEKPFKRDLIKLYRSTLAWERQRWDTSIVLKRATLSVQQGELLAIAGHTGSGKSSLLYALLGELHIVEGSIQVNGSVSFCSQKAWTINDTIRNNILVRHNGRYNKERYNKVLEACHLSQLIAGLPNGDETFISTHHAQCPITSEHRRLIHLARSVYREADIYFFDAPFSGLNSVLAMQIFNDVIGNNGILKGKTRVLVLNSASSFHNVDRIILLHKGEIIEEGSYFQLLKNKRRFSSTIGELLDNIDNFEIEPEVKQSDETIEADQYVEQGFTLERSNSLLGDVQAPSAPNKSIGLQEEQTLDSKPITWNTYWSALQSFKVIFLIEMIMFFVMSRACDILAGLWFSKYSVNKKLMNKEQRNLRLTVYGLLGVGHGLVSLLSSFILRRRLRLSTNAIHNNLVERLVKAPYSFFCLTNPSSYQVRFFKDIDLMDVQFPMASTLFLELLFQLCGVILVNCIYLPPFIVICCPLILLSVILQVYYIRTLRQLKRFDTECRSKRRDHVSETLAGQTTIRHHELSELYSNKMADLNDDVQQCSYLMMMARFWMTIRLDAIGNVLVLAINLLVISEKGILSPGLAGFLSSYTLGTVGALNTLIHYAAEVALSLVTCHRLSEFYTKIPVDDSQNFNRNDLNSDLTVRFSNYCARYIPNTPYALKRVHLCIKPGEKIGIVGQAGSGKSTLAYALFRLFDPTEGKLCIGNTNVTKLNIHRLRQTLSILPQDTALFNASLRFNLDPTGNCTEKELWQAVDASRFNGLLPQGLDTEVGEDSGYYLSHGQQHLMCLARAILQKAKIIVVDEFSTSVDLETEHVIMQTISKLFQKCTVIIITNKIYNVMNCDRVIVMRDGRIAEEGPPSRLIHNKESEFYDLAVESGLISQPTFEEDSDEEVYTT